MKSPKVDTSGQERAAKAAAEAQAAANNLQANFATDLKTENLGQVVAGGTAEQMDTSAATTMKRKKPQASLASQLGINV
jgi:hypothetical protein